jgi:hypothetical protein
MNKRNIVKQYVYEGVLYTICKPQKTPRTQWTSRHLGKSDSAVAKFTGKYNHA